MENVRELFSDIRISNC